MSAIIDGKHQYFTAERTSLTIPYRGAVAIICGDAPKRNWADKTNSYSMRGPLLLIPQEMWHDDKGLAEKIARILDEHAAEFFDSAKPSATEVTA